MATRMQQRRGTHDQWISTNSGNGPILAPGEIGFESDTNKFKIGDGVNHWIDLVYFTDAQSAIDSLSSLVDGAPDLLNTLNELAAALGDDPTFFTTVATNLSNHESDTTNVHGIADTSLLATTEYVDGAVSGVTTDLTTMAGVGLDYNIVTDQFDIDSTVATKTYADGKASDAESAAISAAALDATTKANNAKSGAETTAANALASHESDTTNIHGIADTAELATKAFAASLLTGATKTNIAITGDKNGLTITAENGVADSTTSDLTEGVNLYFTDERAQDAVGNSVGTGLTYTDSTGVISVTPNTYDAYGSASAVAGDLSSHASDTTDIHGIADTSLLATKAYADAAVAAVVDAAPAQLDTLKELATALANDGNYATTINNALATKAPLASPAFSGTVTGITKAMVGLGSVDNTADTAKPISDATQTALNFKAPLESPTFTGTVGGITKSMVGLGNVDNTSDLDKPVSNATQTALDAKANTAAPTFTGTVTLPSTTSIGNVSATEIAYVDGVTSGIQSQLDSKAPLSSPTFTGTVTLPTGTVTSEMIADGTIVNADISATAAIALSKLATDPLARANHTGTQTASTISDFDTQVRTSKVTDLTAPTGSFSMNSQKITNLAAPTSANDAATMAYVDAATAGLNVHASVKAATTGNVNLNNALENNDVLDGVTLATGNRVLVKNQNTAEDNGVYIVQANGAAIRATDYNSVPNVNAGDFIYVESGTVNGKTGWVQTENPTTIGTDPIAFTQFSGAGVYTANNGLTLTGNQFSINTAITADLTTAQTLTNKTLTSPVINTPTGITKSDVGLSNVDNTSDANKPVSTATQTALDAKLSTSTAASTYAPIASPTFTGTVSGITKSMVGLGNVDNTSDANKPVSTATQTVLDLKAPLASPTFTGTVAGITKSMVGLSNVDNTSDADKPVSSAAQSALNLKAPLASPTFTGTVTLPTGTVTSGMILDETIVDGDISSSAAIAQSKVSGLTTDLGLKAPLASPALTGVPTAPTATAGTNTTQVATTEFVGTAVADLVASAPAALNTLNELATALGNDASFSTTITNSLATKAPLANPTFTGTVSGISKSMVGLGNVDNTSDVSKPISNATQTALDLKAPLANPTFTGTVAGVTKAHVGLGNVDNTADSEKPVSTATQTALDLKANLASPTFTGIITIPQARITGGSTTVSANTATTVDTTALASFTTIDYTVSIKQGSKIRSSKVLVQTDGTTVDSVEHSILETGGVIAGVNVTAAVSSTNCILTVTITDAATTNATVKVINTII